jgi:ribosomal protein S18 acetylase RimI-like enzyme
MLVAAEHLPAEALRSAFEAAFADYLAGPFAMDAERWPLFLERQQADLGLSRAVVNAAGEVQALALVAPRPGRWRLAGMGVRPAARGGGASRLLMDDFVARGERAGVAALELEVFEQNEPAVRLYRRYGFEPRQRLMAYRAAAKGGAAVEPAFPDLGREAALAWLAAQAIEDLPMQVGATVLAVNHAPWRAWRAGAAQAVFLPAEGRVSLLSLVDTDPAQAGAERLVAALQAAYPDCEVQVPPLQRDDLGGVALQRLGCVREPLNQWLMRRDLRA